jgi:hypothetical protein
MKEICETLFLLHINTAPLTLQLRQLESGRSSGKSEHAVDKVFHNNTNFFKNKNQILEEVRGWA